MCSDAGWYTLEAGMLQERAIIRIRVKLGIGERHKKAEIKEDAYLLLKYRNVTEIVKCTCRSCKANFVFYSCKNI